MDTIKTTVTEDALGKDVKHPASASTCEMNSTEKPDKETSFNTEKETKANQEEADDLLEKIEEVVNDKISSTIMDNDISQSSEHDFIKKIEEIENDVVEAKGEKGPSKGQENKQECDSDKVIVGKLVMEVSSGSDGKNEKVVTNDSNGEGGKDLVSSASADVCENETLPEDSKTVEADIENKVVDSTSENVKKEVNSRESSTCSKSKEIEKKADTDAVVEKQENVLSENAGCVKGKDSSDKCSEVPDTTTDKESILSKSEESVVTTSEDKSDKEVLIKKSPTESSNEVSESLKTDTAPVEGATGSLKKTSERTEVVESKTKTTESTTEAKQKPEATEEPKSSVESKEIKNKLQKKDEPMVIDLTDLEEPMDVDSEEKMDVDAVSDDACEENDEEMKPAEQIVQKEQKTTNVAPKETLKSKEDLKSPAVAEACTSDGNKHIPKSKANEETTKKPELDTEVKANTNKEEKPADKVQELQKREKAEQPGQTSEANKKLPISKSPIASKNVTAKPMTKTEARTEISAAATAESKADHKNKAKVEVPISKPSLKKTIAVEEDKKAGGDCLASTKYKVAEKDAKSAEKISEEKSNTCQKSESKSDKKGAAGDCPVKDPLPVAKISESAEADSTEGKEILDNKKEIEKKEVEPVKMQEKEKESKDIKIAEDKKAENIKKKVNEPIQKETPKKEEVRKEEETPESSKTASSAQVESEILTEIKEQRSSDSTASLSSTVDEQIIKFGMETTLPLEPDQPAKKIENKPLINMMKHGGSTPSLNTTPVTAPNVFNSTPIQKQFEISSENVSKISETNESSRTEKTVEEDANLNKSSKPEYSTESGTTCTTTSHQSSTEHHSSDHPDSGHQTSDGIAKYINVIKNYNGITDSTTDDEEVASNVKGALSSGFGILSSPSSSDIKNDILFEINVWYEQNYISFLSVEEVQLKKISATLLDKTSGTEQASSSNGSVTSLPPFNLPSARLSEVSSNSSANPNTPPQGKAPTSQIKKNKFKIQGINQLCNFMIDEFTKIKKNLHSGELQVTIPKDNKDVEEEPTTPKSQSKEPTKKNLAKGKSASPAISESSPSPVRAEKRSRKRSFTKSQSEEEDEGKSKAKQPRKSQGKSHGTPSKEIESVHSDQAGQCVLAKWIDKKYYAGKITGEKPGNKYIVLFEDGASKVLPKESIVFGEEDSLPLKDRSVHALVDDDYECGIVLSVDKVDDKILYTVKAETKTVKVTASDIYLQEDQAKAIQNVNAQKTSTATSPEEPTATGSSRPTRNKRASTSPVTPEPGFSGGAGKKGAKRQKRYS